MAAIVSLQGVRKSYRRGAQCLEVLRDVDLEIEAGELVALTGPSGSGKTTMLNLIGGLDGPDAGAIIVAGLRIDTLSADGLSDWCGQHVGFVFQFYHLLPALSAERNVELPLLTTQLSRYERRRNARAALDLVGLIRCADHRAAELSGSQQQRVAIARALAAGATILLCDEPTGDLDRQTSNDILDLLQSLNERLGTTIIMVTHDRLAARYAARTVPV